MSATNISGRGVYIYFRRAHLFHGNYQMCKEGVKTLWNSSYIFYITACGCSNKLGKTWLLCHFWWCQEAGLLCFSPWEPDDKTDLGACDQGKLFSQAIFQCHCSLCLIHEVSLSGWYHLSSSSLSTRLSWPLSSCSSGDRWGKSVNQRLEEDLLHFHPRLTTKKSVNLICCTRLTGLCLGKPDSAVFITCNILYTHTWPTCSQTGYLLGFQLSL